MIVERIGESSRANLGALAELISPRTGIIRSLSRVAFYILSPCLVFNSLSHSTLTGGDVVGIGLVAMLTTGAVALLAYLAGKTLRLERHLLVSLVVAAAFGNAGNFGLAANKFAFGDEALARAVIYYVFSTLSVYTLGVAVASSGKKSWREVVQHGLLLPTTFAIVIAGLLRLAQLAAFNGDEARAEAIHA